MKHNIYYRTLDIGYFKAHRSHYVSQARFEFADD